MKVGFQGEPGAYSEMAAVRMGKPQGFKTFDQVFRAIIQGEVSFGVLPLENSLGGSIHENFDHLLKYPVKIVADTYVKVEHCLMGLPGSSLESARQILSHPQALVQCDQLLRSHPKIEVVATYDTAGSAKLIQEAGSKDKLAIASERAAEIYGLKILKRGIATSSENYTRFAVVAPESGKGKSSGGPKPSKLGKLSGRRKTTIVFSLPHETGSLFHALSVFALRKINLTKLETRPLRKGKFEYLFYIDFEEPSGSKAQVTVEQALNHLGEIALFLKVLGNYSTLS